jgi:ATP-binding cassette subfamily C protein
MPPDLRVAVADADRLLRGGLALCLLLTLFVDIAILVVPIYDMQLYDRVIQSRNLDTVVFLSLACLAGLVLYGLVDMLRSAALLAIADGIATRLQMPLLHQAVAGGLAGDATSSTQAIRDIHHVRSFLGSGAVCVPLDVLCGGLLLTVLFLLHPAYGFLGLGGAALLVLLNLLTDALTRADLLAANSRQQRLAGELSERLRNPEVTEGLGMLPAIGRRFARENAAVLQQLHHAHARAHGLAGVSKMAKILLQAAVMILGAVMILAHATTPGSLMGANLLLNKLLGPFDALVGAWRHWALALAAWRRIRALRSATIDHAASMPLTEPRWAEPRWDTPVAEGLVLRDVTFRAPGEGRVLLSCINLTVPPGCLLGVVGPNGAGKSTLLRLLAGLFPPTEGAIFLDGTPLQSANRPQIGYLPQNVGLLDGSVFDNIARFAPDNDPIAAARDAGVHELIGRLPGGYETDLRPDAPALSGGQVQRIGLARALLGAPRLLVLDEPDASLDHAGEDALAATLLAVRARGGIVVLTTHRPGLLAVMDRLLELQDGRVVSTERTAPQTSRIRMQPA